MNPKRQCKERDSKLANKNKTKQNVNFTSDQGNIKYQATLIQPSDWPTINIFNNPMCGKHMAHWGHWQFSGMSNTKDKSQKIQNEKLEE